MQSGMRELCSASNKLQIPKHVPHHNNASNPPAGRLFTPQSPASCPGLPAITHPQPVGRWGPRGGRGEAAGGGKECFAKSQAISQALRALTGLESADALLQSAGPSAGPCPVKARVGWSRWCGPCCPETLPSPSFTISRI